MGGITVLLVYIFRYLLCLPLMPCLLSHLPGRGAVGGDVFEVVGDAVRHAVRVAEGGVAGETLGRSCGARVAVGQRRLRGRRCCHRTALDHGVLERNVRHCRYLEDERVMVVGQLKWPVGSESVAGKGCEGKGQGELSRIEPGGIMV